jgi:hypothetical protein
VLFCLPRIAGLMGGLSVFLVVAAAVRNDLRNNAAVIAESVARGGTTSGTIRMKRAVHVGKSAMREL